MNEAKKNSTAGGIIPHLRVACVIPARLASTRFPRKILKKLGDKPLVQWAWDASQRAAVFSEVIIAIDSEETEQVVKQFGGAYIMTSPQCACGTDRLIEVMNSGRIYADVWVNWQADEPFITQNLISKLLETVEQNDADVWSLRKRIFNEVDITNPNVAKVVCDNNGYALYFSRSPIPFYREDFVGEKIFYKHIGLFAYSTEALKKISQLEISDLEKAEKLEQLRFLQHRLKIKLHEVEEEVCGIDTIQDLEKAEQIIQSNNNDSFNL